MAKKVIHIPSEEAVVKAADELLSSCISRKIFAIYGDMGAGKTTLIKAICAQLGSTDHFSSPTFSIVNEYHDKEEDPVYHIDLYRLKELEEAMEIGMEEYLNSGHYCFIEWPQLIEPILPEHTQKVKLEVEPNNSRNLIIE